MVQIKLVVQLLMQLYQQKVLAVTLVFIDSTQGWLVTDSGLQDEAPTALYITATGGTITTLWRLQNSYIYRTRYILCFLCR